MAPCERVIHSYGSRTGKRENATARQVALEITLEVGVEVGVDVVVLLGGLGSTGALEGCERNRCVRVGVFPK